MCRRGSKSRRYYSGKQQKKEIKYECRLRRENTRWKIPKSNEFEAEDVQILSDFLGQNDFPRPDAFPKHHIRYRSSTAYNGKNHLLYVLLCISLILTGHVADASETVKHQTNGHKPKMLNDIPAEIEKGILRKLPPTVRKIAEETYRNADYNAKRNMRIIAKGSRDMLDVIYTTCRGDIRYEKYDKDSARRSDALVVSLAQANRMCNRYLDVVYNPSFFEHPINGQIGEYKHENVHVTNIICTELKNNGSSNPYYDHKGWLEFHRNLDAFTSTLEAVVRDITSTLKSEYSVADNDLVLIKYRLPTEVTPLHISLYQQLNYSDVITIQGKVFNDIKCNIKIIPESLKLGAKYVTYYFVPPNNPAINFLINAFGFIEVERLYRNTVKYASEMSAYIDQFFPRDIQKKLCNHYVKAQDRFRNECLYALQKIT